MRGRVESDWSRGQMGVGVRKELGPDGGGGQTGAGARWGWGSDRAGTRW